VIRYAYLWDREAQAGREEGVKDRPCAVVLARQQEDGIRVYVLPITHSAPAASAIEIPAVVKARLGLDAQRSWIVVSEMNVFMWPGPDLRFVAGQGPETVAYGFLPPRFFRAVRERFLTELRSRQLSTVRRTD
jgi:hypothetical protein